MKLTAFVRDRSDVELTRLVDVDAGRWNSTVPYFVGGGCGCLIAHAFACARQGEFIEARRSLGGDLFTLAPVEDFYMDLARRNGEAETGALISRLARRELGRRAMAAIGELAVPESVEVGR